MYIAMNGFLLLSGGVAGIGCICLLLLVCSPTKGWAGEMLVRLVLKFTAPKDSIIFNNLYFHNGRQSCQIDHLIISPKGVFVVETKTFLGEVSGEALGPKIHRRVLGMSYWMRNPVEQNEYHLRFLRDNLPVIRAYVGALRSIVVYSFMTRLRITGNPGFIGTLRDIPYMLARYGTASLSLAERDAIAAEIGRFNRR